MFSKLTFFFFFGWFHENVWRNRRVSIRMSLVRSTCFLIFCHLEQVSLSLVISLYPKWDYRTRWSPQHFFFFINIKFMVPEDFENRHIFLGIYFIFPPIKWEWWPINLCNHQLRNFQMALGSRHPAIHCTNLFVINILCPFSFSKLRFWYFFIGNSLPLVLNVLLKVTNPLSDLTIYWHLRLYFHFLQPQMRTGNGVSLSFLC